MVYLHGDWPGISHDHGFTCQKMFPVVFIVDDFGKDVTEETRRLLYVAMTRAKERLFLCSDGQGIVSRLIAS